MDVSVFSLHLQGDNFHFKQLREESRVSLNQGGLMALVQHLFNGINLVIEVPLGAVKYGLAWPISHLFCGRGGKEGASICFYLPYTTSAGGGVTILLLKFKTYTYR